MTRLITDVDPSALLEPVRNTRDLMPRAFFDEWLDFYVATLYESDDSIHGWHLPWNIAKARRILTRYISVRDAARRAQTTDPFPYRIDSLRLAYPCVMNGRRAVWDPRPEYEVQA